MSGAFRQYLQQDTPEEEARLLHRMFVITAAIMFIGSAAALWVQAPNYDPLDLRALPAVAAVNLLLIPAVLTGRLDPRPAFLASYAVDALYLLSAYAHQYEVFAPLYGLLSQNTYWFPALYVGAFLIFPHALARYLTQTLLALTVLITAVQLGRNPALLNHRDLIGSVTQFLLVSMVLQVMLIRFGAMRDRLSAMQTAAYRDALTGAYNRRYAEEHLASLQASHTPYSLILMDLDHFKSVNDQHGHAVGDGVLVGVTRLTRNVLPEGGMVARWGGEEFLILLPQRSEEDLRHFIGTLREQYQTLHVGSLLGVTACFGVAHGGPDETPESVLARADAAMYLAKNGGRDDLRFAGHRGARTRSRNPTLTDLPVR